MTLTVLAYALVIVFMTAIMTRRLSPMTALILVPVTFGLLAGFGASLGEMMLAGVTKLAPTGVMLLFAILYFAIMLDAGLFEPFVQRLVRLVHGDPVRVVVGSAALALLVSLDGDGSTTYMITTAAMLPVYRRMRLRPLVLACVTMLASGVMNLLPWGGPTARASSALALEVGEVFTPLVPSMVMGIAWVLYVAYRLGVAEQQRLAGLGSQEVEGSDTQGLVVDDDDHTHRRPDRLMVNALLTVVLLAALVAAAMPLPVLFMVAFAVALVLNYPSIDEQKALLTRHAGNALAVVGLIFAAGVFTGILSGTKMIDAMADSVVQLVPPGVGPHFAVVGGLLSIPFTFFISNDAFYYGVLPILARAGEQYGIHGVEMARASLIGQPVHLLSPLVPSTFLLVGLCGVDFDAHQRFTFRWALATALVLLITALITGIVPFHS